MKTYSFADIMLAELREKRDIARGLAEISRAGLQSLPLALASKWEAEQRVQFSRREPIATINGRPCADLGASWRKGWGI